VTLLAPRVTVAVTAFESPPLALHIDTGRSEAQMLSAAVSIASTMVPAGYLAKRVVERPNWLPVERVSSNLFRQRLHLPQLRRLHQILETQRLFAI
jgi:hypothetical protein